MKAIMGEDWGGSKISQIRGRNLWTAPYVFFHMNVHVVHVVVGNESPGVKKSGGARVPGPSPPITSGQGAKMGQLFIEVSNIFKNWGKKIGPAYLHFRFCDSDRKFCKSNFFDFFEVCTYSSEVWFWIQSLRGQPYDGASGFQEAHSGVGVRILAKNPKAMPTHFVGPMTHILCRI